MIRANSGDAYQEPVKQTCMYCGRKYDLNKRINERITSQSTNALSCCSNRCLALEDSLQETS